MSDLAARIKALREAHEKLKPCGGGRPDQGQEWHWEARVLLYAALPALLDVAEAADALAAELADGFHNPDAMVRYEELRAALERLARGE